jgi:mitochondrial fission protein ELM1
MASTTATVRIGVISDGKAGHVNQSLGLADALCRLRPALSVVTLPLLSAATAWARLLRPGSAVQGFDLLIAAGHRTHLSLLAYGRVERCPTVVLMRPSLPGWLFALRVEPRHDGGVESGRCWLSEGPLNRMRPAAQRSEEGLILVGGPSKHYRWDTQAVLDQIAAICARGGRWVMSGSRRTPEGFMEQIDALKLDNLEAHRPEELPAGWLAERLPGAPACWVSPDSASMVYEAMSAGCAVGVFDLEPLTGSRVAAAIADLGDRGLVTSFGGFRRGLTPAAPSQPLAEADRIAARILQRGWL